MKTGVSYLDNKIKSIKKLIKYQLIYVGWHNRRRIYGSVMHLDIKDSKIWIQWNGTEDDIAAELVEMGVPKQDIVLGFHTPHMRQFTDFAVG